MKKCVVIHRQDQNNVGDIASNPLQYFLKEHEYQTIDITQIHATAYDSHLPVIVGGGGLIGNEFFGDTVRNVLHSSDKNQLLNLWNQRWEVSDPANKELNEDFLVAYKNFIKEYI